jgi:hypothetical protein
VYGVYFHQVVYRIVDGGIEFEEKISL